MLAGTPTAQEAPSSFRSGTAAVGVGTGYRLELEPERSVFHAFPDSAAASDETALRFIFESVARGATETKLGAGAPAIDGDVLRADRGAGVTEHWELEDLGAKLSFVFDVPPAGTGDLVVRGRLDTGLQVSTATEAYIDLLDPEFGGVRIGAVLGIDADGREAAGALRLDGDALELSLPADFVDAATYPLILDPLVSPIAFTVDSDVGIANPDAARSNWKDENFMVAYEREVEGVQQIVGRIFTADGTLLGQELLVETTAENNAHSPRVAIVRDRFLVVWHAEIGPTGMIRVRAYDTDGSNPSSDWTVYLNSTGDIDGSHDVSGRTWLGTADTTALLVWETATGGIKRALVDVPPAGEPSMVPGSLTDLTTPNLFSSDSEPRISPTSGELGNAWAVTWVRTTVSFVGGSTTNVMGQVLDGNGNPVGGATTLGTGEAGVLSRPWIDGDGTNFVAVWEHTSDGLFQTATVWARALKVFGGTLVPKAEPVQLAGALFNDARDPRVVHGPGRSLVTYARSARIDAVGISSETAEIVESEFVVNAAAAPLTGHALAAGRKPGLGSSDHAVSLSNVALVGGNSLHGNMLKFLGPGGPVTDLGGGCGAGGTAVLSEGPVAIGNTGLRFELTGADLSAVAGFFNLNVGTPLPVTCGPCAITPVLALFPAFVSGGVSEFGLSIPADPALVDALVEVQWITLTPGTTGCDLVPEVSFSNRLRLEIGL